MHPYKSTQIDSLVPDLWKSLRHPDYWAYSSWLAIATKYRRTSLGIVWAVAPFAVFVIVLGNVYSHLMDNPLTEFLPYLGTGYLLWRFMIQVITDAVGTFHTHKAFIMEGRVRLTDFILSSFAKAGFHLLLGGLVMLAVYIWSPAIHLSSLWTLLLTMPLLIANVAWIAVCVAMLGARAPDVQEAIGTVLILGLLLTPILWSVEKFPADTLRGGVVRFNPAFHMLDVVRAPLLGKMPETTSIVVVLVMAVLGWIVASLLYRRYGRFVALWI
ncbi:ABC transporter permease [Luteimonas terricola]|uniref:Sugar ABC transporter permease n=1 Tax=Luteimonas terricola TaxID=645597 RepID=A0ABQ2EIS2_9GAMM|nr:ABC transporter permease [Luteimonas terricola]GGK13435.1 sugar ABC transporter permease [Luteimonas terricola]